MFTTARDLILPTTVTGSWPRPRWYTARLGGRPLSSAMEDIAFREQFTDAMASMLDEQERAGLDIVTHGDYFHDEDLGGHSWLRYPLERWRGLKGDYLRVNPEMPAFPPGTILNEVFSGWRSPRVVDRVEPNDDAPLEYAKIWRLAQARTSKPVRFGTVSAQTLSIFLEFADGHYREDDRHALIWDMAEAMNIELRSVADAGCTAIQVEDPLLHYVACYQPENTELIDFLVSAFNREIQGLENVEVWAHTCWGNPNMQRGMIGSYANSLEILLERIDADVVTIECRDDNGSELELFRPYRSSLRKKIAIGAVSHRTLQVESPADVAQLTMRAVDVIGAENLILSSDCGFGRQGANRLIAFYKAAAIAQGANIVRRQLGLPEREVPCAVPEMQPDVVTTPTSRWFGGVVGS